MLCPLHGPEGEGAGKMLAVPGLHRFSPLITSAAMRRWHLFLVVLSPQGVAADDN